MQPLLPPLDGLVIQTCGPLAAGAPHWGTRMLSRFGTAPRLQGSKNEDHGREPTELAARSGAATRT